MTESGLSEWRKSPASPASAQSLDGRWALPTNANVLALALASRNGQADKRLDRCISLIEIGSQQIQSRIPIQAQGELGQIVGAD